MSQILYTAIAQGPVILVSSGESRFEKLVEKLLGEVKGEQRKAYVHEEFSFNYSSNAQGFVFVAVCDEAFPTRVAFTYLQHIEKNFQPAAASRYEDTIAAEMKKYSDPQKVDKIEAIKTNLENVKEVMKENIEKIMERGEVLESLEASTAALDHDSQQFLNKATSLKNAMWWKNQKLRIALIVVISIIVFAIIWGSCGATFQHCNLSLLFSYFFSFYCFSGRSEPAPQPESSPTPTPTPV